MLLGPTASGKSAAAMAIAERFDVEIISVDSAQIYRGMDIGTAKPDAKERARVAHHLIDIVDPSERYSAARFAEDASRLIRQIGDRGRIALLVGGTMLYAKALAEGLHDLPAADPEIRHRIEQEALTAGWPALHARLARVDPSTASRLDPHDAQRIQRALEIFEQCGEPMSVLLARPRPGQPDARFFSLALEPSKREVLHERIARRFDQMLAQGLIEEVATLRARSELSLDLPSMRCVGYRQVWEHLEGQFDRTALRERAIAATRQLAKRQLTWLRSMPQRLPIDCIDAAASERVVDRFAELIKSR
jgi:tRNA dimethylallyltransferase